MDNHQELEALLALTTVVGLGSVKIRQLVGQFGSARGVLAASRGDWLTCRGMTPSNADAIEDVQRIKSPRSLLAQAQALGADVIAYTDPRYPKRLLEIDDHPVVLYAQGELLPVDQRSIAIVGTRNATLYGRDMARRFGQQLAAEGFTVVSGLARGVDTEAHLGALQSGRTVAVIGSGLADVYPAENLALSRQISMQGALLSEFPMHTPPDRHNFPQRNRIVSGMTQATLLIEAPVKSGAMITMDRALSQGRRLFALPGRVDNESFKGNHALIKSGRARLVEDVNDILAAFEDLFAGIGSKRLPSQPVIMPQLPPDEHRVVTLLSSEELSIEELAQRTELPISKLSVILMSLVLKRRLKEYPGKIYKKYTEVSG